MNALLKVLLPAAAIGIPVYIYRDKIFKKKPTPRPNRVRYDLPKVASVIKKGKESATLMPSSDFVLSPEPAAPVINKAQVTRPRIAPKGKGGATLNERPVIVLQRQQLADGSIISNIIGSSAPGAKKLQFPYELPTVTVGIDNETKAALYTSTGILATGFIAGQFLNRFL